MTEHEHKDPPVWLSAFALVVTNCIKLGGLGVALDQVFIRQTAQPVALAVAAFMMAGAQGVEEAALHFFARFFGHAPDAPARRRRRRRS